MKIIVVILSLFLVNCGCKGVIGVVYNQNGIVRNVFPDSPASKIGLELNDRILDHKSTQGIPGEEILVRWMRDGKLHEEKVKRVCVDDLDTEW